MLSIKIGSTTIKAHLTKQQQIAYLSILSFFSIALFRACSNSLYDAIIFLGTINSLPEIMMR